MIHLPNSNPYIIAFTQGSSGRLVRNMLADMLSGKSEELILCPVTNSTHRSDQKRYTGFGIQRAGPDPDYLGNSHPNIWNVLKFDDHSYDPEAPRIFPTHRFPEFDLIRNRLGPDVKIIIVTISAHDLMEVVLNDKVKNHYDLLTGRSRDIRNPNVFKELHRRYERFLGKRFPGTYVKQDIIQIAKRLAVEHLEYFLAKSLGNATFEDEDADTRLGKYLILPQDIDYQMDQILFLPYSEISKQVNGEYVWLTKLEEFTGKTANAATKESYQRYMAGRNQLLKEYRI